MNLRIGIAEGDGFRYRREGSLWRVDDVRIGHGFHWQQDVSMLLDGLLEEIALPDGRKALVNTVNLERYLESVVSSEMSASAPFEFIKAHAIISRSWVAGKIRSLRGDAGEKPTDPLMTWEDAEAHALYDVCADDHCQRYQGVAEVNDAVRRAVAETSGMVLKDSAGRLVDARFSKCCGGVTELFSTCWQDRDYDYLQRVIDPWCEKASPALASVVLKQYDRGVDYLTWTARISKRRLREKVLERFGTDLGEITSMEAVSRGASGRIKALRIAGTKADLTVGKELTIRRLLADDCLKSSWFDIEDTGSGFILHGRGWGHGVGMCQIGGAAMAEAGHSHSEILDFYYPNTHISEL